ncbi:SufS family cysteine desulfurase [Candidatus Peregrinibacteria bacterium]|nr:SufS family cysteine desulfurase [Candidatus Peregrinibacteria bacterium]
MTLDISAIRRQFPILDQELIYLDSAATAQKPQIVIDALKEFYAKKNANVHRGMHGLAEQATTAYENARTSVQKFINAASPEEIIFTKSCTESINLVANSYSSRREGVRGRGSVVLSLLEHHSNIVPWMMCGAHLHWINIDEYGNTRLEQLDTYLKQENIELVAITGQSNVLGTRPPLKEIIQKAHAAGAYVLVDAAQLVAHHQVNVQELDCDFLAFSAHKLYGPTGIGVLYGKRELLEKMPPFIGGGMMIKEATQTGFTPADIPQKFEGGTPPIAQAIGLAAALEWLEQFAWKDIEEHEHALLKHAEHILKNIDGLKILPACHPEPDEGRHAQDVMVRRAHHDMERSGCLSFVLDKVHPHDLTDILGEQGICLRAGHHCAMPLHKRLNIPASTRVSFGIYNTIQEIDILADAIQHAQKILQ